MLVTKESLIELLNTDNAELRMHTIGHALKGLFYRQEQHERTANTTNVNNMVGFTGADAFKGCLAAKYYIKHGKLEDWMIAHWVEPNVKGTPRIAKYWRQLNEIAEKKAKRKKLLESEVQNDNRS